MDYQKTFVEQLGLIDRVVQFIARKHRLSAQDAAWSVCEIVDENMASAVREHAVEVGKGLDGRTLIAIGGMAPLHGARLAAKLGLDHVIVPVGAGVGSALGFLRAPVSFEATRSVLLGTAQFDADAANAIINAGGRLQELNIQAQNLDEIYTRYFEEVKDVRAN